MIPQGDPDEEVEVQRNPDRGGAEGGGGWGFGDVTVLPRLRVPLY